MNEQAVVIGSTSPLHGITTYPAIETVDGSPAVIMLNAGLLHRIGPHRTYVRIARELAQKGFLSLRFDFAGIGDSPSRRDRMLAGESHLSETLTAMDFMSDTTGANRFVLLGLCSGARDGLRTGASDARVVGVVMIDPFAYPTLGFFLRHYGPRLFRWKSWAKRLSRANPILRQVGGAGSEDETSSEKTEWPTMFQPKKSTVNKALESVTNRGIHLCVIHTGGWEYVYNYREQFSDSFRSVDFRGRLRLEYLEHANHTFTLLTAQQQLADTVCDWMTNTKFDSFATAAD